MLQQVRFTISIVARRFRSRAVLELENLALRHQLHVLRRPTARSAPIWRETRHELAETRAAGPDEITAHLAPFARTVTLWFLSHVGNLGLLLVQFLLTTMIAAILYANGETAARGMLTFANRLAGPAGEKAMHLAAQAVRGVALGVVVAAILQSILAGVGLAVAGVPFAAFLTAVMFILSVAQIGPGPVLIAAVIFVYSRSGALRGTGLLVWAIFCVAFDNVVRPGQKRRTPPATTLTIACSR